MINDLIDKIDKLAEKVEAGMITANNIVEELYYVRDELSDLDNDV